jgi:hypothetical protein
MLGIIMKKDSKKTYDGMAPHVAFFGYSLEMLHASSMPEGLDEAEIYLSKLEKLSLSEDFKEPILTQLNKAREQLNYIRVNFKLEYIPFSKKYISALDKLRDILLSASNNVDEYY